MSRYLVNRCICHSRSFKEIKAYAEESGITSVEELQAEDFCSCGCGLCIPYIELMFETGDTKFEPGAYYKKASNAD
jgi:NAD(P)H-nitrite reductase large subunit